MFTTTTLYLKKDSNGEYFSGGSYALGNLCLSDYDGSFFTYWVEDRPLLGNPAKEEHFGNFESTSNDLIQQMKYEDKTEGTIDGRQKWPSSSEEESLFWKEGDYKDSSSGTEVYSPAYWDDVQATDAHVEKMVALARHYGMSQREWQLQCFISDSDALYSAAIADKLSIESLPNDKITDLLKQFITDEQALQTLQKLMTGFAFSKKEDTKALGFVVMWWANILD